MSVEVHDEWGCSRHDGLLKCLGYKSGPGGVAAQQGQQMHHIAETIIKSGWTEYKFPDLFETGNVFSNDYRLMVVDYTNAVKSLYEKYKKEYGDDLVFEVEYPVSIPELEISVSTIDVLFYVPFQFIHVVDFKTGQKPVSPTSAQMRGYILGALNAGPATEYRASIFQPALSNEFLTAKFTYDECIAHEKMMKLVLHAAKREHVPCTPCEYCGWCVRNGECPATKAQLAMIAIDADKYDVTRSTLAILAEYAMKIEDIIGSLKQRAYAILEAGERLPLPDGRELMLVDGRPSYVWKNPKEAETVLLNLAKTRKGATTDEEAKAMVWLQKEPEMLSPAKAKDLFGKSKPVLQEIDPLIWKVDGKKKLGIGKTAIESEQENG